MRIIAYFKDIPGMLAHRARYETEHSAYLKANQKEILIAGGLREKPDDKFFGGLWVMEVASLERAEVLVQNDPYYIPELRNYKLLVWEKILDCDVIL